MKITVYEIGLFQGFAWLSIKDNNDVSFSMKLTPKELAELGENIVHVLRKHAREQREQARVMENALSDSNDGKPDAE